MRAGGVRDDLFTSLGDVIPRDLSDFLIYAFVAINSSAFASSLRLCYVVPIFTCFEVFIFLFISC